jgi:hypothetical protein
MKKLIGMAAFVTIVLFGSTHKAPSLRAGAGASSSPMATSSLVAQGPTSLVCTWPTPFCCEPDPDGDGCYACAGNGTQCP